MTADHDDGSISIEWAMMAPLIFLVLAFLYAFARIENADGNLDSATRDAARAASEAPSASDAQLAVDDIMAKEFAGIPCIGGSGATGAPTATISGTFAGGQTLTVTATCTYDISDIGLPGAPGSATATSVFSSMIDPNRTIG